MSRKGRPNHRNTGGPKVLALSILEHAAREMRDTERYTASTRYYSRDKGRLRADAIVWLASTRATRWFDACGLDQRYTLARMGWPQHAKELLGRGTSLDRAKVRVLELGLDAISPAK